jgi:CRP-like cAMP-binding protein
MADQNGSRSRRLFGESILNKLGDNRLLALLPASDRERVVGLCRRGKGTIRDTVYRQDEEIADVYFPLSGMASLVLGNAEDDVSIEVGMIGNEGVVGAATFLGSKTSPTIAMWQASAEFLTISTKDFLAATASSAALSTVVARYTQALHNQITQSVLCNNVHPIEQRLCRWLLMTRDRVGMDELPLTQEFISQMLGTRRPSVTIAAGMLQQAGLITMRRGLITVVDRPGLEAGSCDCYGRVRGHFEELLA